jgi:hypothetical protein
MLVLVAALGTTGCGERDQHVGPSVIVAKYLGARSWTERLEHVLHPQSVNQALTARGVDPTAPLEPTDAARSLEITPESWRQSEEGELVVVRPASKLVDPRLKRGYRSIDEIYLFKTRAGFRVDDHATWGRNPLTIDELRALGPDATLKLRVMVKPDKRYPSGHNKDRLSLHLAFPTETWIGASAARDSEVGRHLERLLAGGEPRKVVLEVRTTGRPGWVSLQVEKVLQDGWAFWDPTNSFMNQWAGPSRAAVEVGEVDVLSGQFTADRIRGIANLHVEEIRACYKQGLAVHPGLRGEITVRAQLMMDGSVLVASVGETIPGDPGVGKCLADTLRTWTFNNPDNWKRSVADVQFILGR